MTFRPDPKPSYTLEKALRKQAQVEQKKADQKKHEAFYRMIWAKKPHKCFEYDTKVPVFSKNNIHHCIEKHLQDHYTVDLNNEDNGVILCLQCHSKTHTNDQFTPKTKARTRLLLKEYEIYQTNR